MRGHNVNHVKHNITDYAVREQKQWFFKIILVIFHLIGKLISNVSYERILAHVEPNSDLLGFDNTDERF